jgi:exodeoxyribonuclease VII small subunit
MTRKAPKDDAPLGFEEALRRLDRAVSQLEGGELDLDGALAEYEQGVHLLTRCRSMLDDAEKQVAILTGVDDDGRPLTSPFDASSAAATESNPAASRSRSSRPVVSEDEDDDLPF